MVSIASMTHLSPTMNALPLITKPPTLSSVPLHTTPHSFPPTPPIAIIPPSCLPPHLLPPKTPLNHALSTVSPSTSPTVPFSHQYHPKPLHHHPATPLCHYLAFYLLRFGQHPLRSFTNQPLALPLSNTYHRQRTCSLCLPAHSSPQRYHCHCPL
jgi:hypothetical protein